MAIFVTQLLYSLKQRYGRPATISRTVDQQINVETGLRETEVQNYNIKKAIILPQLVLRQLLVEGSIVNHRSYYDSTLRNIIIDVSELPKNFEIQMDDIIIIKDKKHQIVNTNDFFDSCGFISSIKEIK